MKKICKVNAFQINSLGNDIPLADTAIYFEEADFQKPETWPTWEDMRKALEEKFGRKVNSFSMFISWKTMKEDSSGLLPILYLI